MSEAVGPNSTTEELIAADAEMTKRLRGPLSNTERMWLVDDRKCIREELARRRKDKPND